MDFPFGDPLGAPNDADLQTRITLSALALLADTVPPANVRDFAVMR